MVKSGEYVDIVWRYGINGMLLCQSEEKVRQRF